MSQRESFPLILLSQSYATAGQKHKAHVLLKEAQTNKQYACPYETGVTHILLGETEHVFQLLEKAVEYQSNCLIFMRRDPRLSSLRKDARFDAILKKIGLNDDAIANYPG